LNPSNATTSRQIITEVTDLQSASHLIIRDSITTRPENIKSLLGENNTQHQDKAIRDPSVAVKNRGAQILGARS
jgi:hypothetical protein